MCTAWGCSGATWVGWTEAAAAAHEKVSAYNGGDVTNSSLCILLACRDDLWCDLWETDRHLPLPYLASNPHTIYGRFMMSWKKGREKKNRGSLINNQRNGDSWHDKGQQSHPRLHKPASSLVSQPVLCMYCRCWQHLVKLPFKYQQRQTFTRNKVCCAVQCSLPTQDFLDVAKHGE